jgi:ADP-ribose pyrophosphatase
VSGAWGSDAREQGEGVPPRSWGRLAEIPLDGRASGATGRPRSLGGSPPAEQEQEQEPGKGGEASREHAGKLSDTREEWPVSVTETPFQGRVTGVRTDVVTMPDGSEVRRDYQTHPGSVAVIALDEQGRVLVLRQYRHPVRQKLWEIPAGLLDVAGEPPLQAAQRELYEEAHVKAADWRVLVDIYCTPGSSDEAIRIFLARGLAEAEGERFQASAEEAEFEYACVPLDELVRGVLAGELHNSCLAVGVLALRAALGGDGVAALRAATAPWPARPYGT